MGHLSARDYRSGLRLLEQLGRLAGDLGNVPRGGRPRFRFSAAGLRSLPARAGRGRPGAAPQLPDGAPLEWFARQALELRQARAALAEICDWLAGEGIAFIEISEPGDVVRCTPRAAQLLARYVGARGGTEDLLPLPVVRRLRIAATQAEGAPLRLTRDVGNLTVDTIVLPGPAGGCLMLLRERARRFMPAKFDALPVTAREREVLTWLAAGKTDREIAEILGISARTVQKHLERLYVKLGVETRTAAVMRALALATAPPVGRSPR
ncbi:MAG TPA: helix-turn-helix transcriptional regulator [Pelomicrobium sp.]|nr:helix-turn-helix transcriptional regulator [Pelomicrobium sp.]